MDDRAGNDTHGQDKKQDSSKKSWEKELKSKRDEWDRTQILLTVDKDRLGYKKLSLEGVLDLVLPRDTDLSLAMATTILQDRIKQQKAAWADLWPEDSVVEEINETTAVLYTQPFSLLVETTDEYSNGKNFSLIGEEAFIKQNRNKKVLCSDGKIRTRAQIWLDSPSRREYPKNLVFKPNRPRDCNGAYNIWGGFTCEPKPGDASPYWNFVRDIICSKNEESYLYVRKWLAYVFQHPDIIHTALVLCGGEGVGKNTFVEILGSIWGRHYSQLSTLSDLTSNFNDHLKHAILVFANEAIWGGNMKYLGLVKAMVTDRECYIEAKYQNKHRFENFRHLIFASNDAWPVHIDHDSRRFFVLNVSHERKEDHEYFRALVEWAGQEGKEFLLYDLLHEDLNGFEPRKLPESDSSFKIKLRSEENPGAYIYDALQAGCFDVGNAEPQGQWGDIGKQNVFTDYIAWCTRNGIRQLCEGQFFMYFKKVITTVKDMRPRSENRKRILIFTDLNQTRKEFEKYFHVKGLEWD